MMMIAGKKQSRNYYFHRDSIDEVKTRIFLWGGGGGY